MKKILVPIDFTTTSMNAAWFAYNIAEKSNAMLYFLHAFRLPLEAIFMPGDIVQDVLFEEFDRAKNGFQEKVESYLKKQCEKAGKEVKSLSKHHFDLKYGFPTDLILDRVRKYDMDMVVMGTKGANERIDVLLGSVTSNVIKKVFIPVLAVPTEAKFDDFKKIVYATGFDSKDPETLEKLNDFATLFNSEVELLHIRPKRTIPNYFDELAQVNFREENDMESTPINTVIEDNVRKGIETYMEENESDLLVLLANTLPWFQNLFIKDTTKQVALHTKTPLLAYH